MKRAGVITIVKDAVDESFGPAVQILAVQKYLKNYNINAEAIVDEHNRKNFVESVLRTIDELKNGRNGIKFIRTKLKFLSNKRKNMNTEYNQNLIHKRKQSYKRFIDKYINISNIAEKDLYPNNPVLNNYDYFVVGSDQVWNPYYPQSDEIKYLHFCPKEKRIAFAPSIARDDIPHRFRKSFEKGINGFPQISIREEKGAEIIKKYTGKEAIVLLDPTMLINVDFWISIEEKPKCKLPTKYILAYFMGNIDEDMIRTISEMEELDIIWLRDFKYSDYYILNPSEYIYLINRAEIICTDSFHMSVFSILFRKKFIVFERDASGITGMNSRITTLLDKFGLSERKYSGGTFKKYFDQPDYSWVDNILNYEQQKAKDFFDKNFFQGDELCQYVSIK